MGLLLIILIILFISSMPIGYAIGFATFLYFIIEGNADLAIVVQRMVAITRSFPLMAIPFFLLAGLIMNHSGITKRIFNFAASLVGHLPGGMGHINVVASMIFAGMSGSAVADTAGLGALEIESMRKSGYTNGFAAAITAASATIGPIIPPSIPMVVFGSIAGVSIGRLFLGGAIPGILMGISLMIIIYVIALKRHYTAVTQRASLHIFLTTFRDAILGLLTPGIILGGIVLGIFTPTEAATVAVVYAIIIDKFVYKELAWRDYFKILVDTVVGTATIMFILTTASSFSWLLTLNMIPQQLATSVSNFSQNPFIIFLILNIIFLFLGCVIEGNAIIIMLTPVLMPLINQVGIDPVHFGVVFVFNLMIGTITPPMGVCMYVCMSHAKITMETFIYEVKWFLVALIATLLLATYYKPVVMFLPNLLMKK